MGITRQQALDCFASDDLIGIGMEADIVRRNLHPEGVVSYTTEFSLDLSTSDTATLLNHARRGTELGATALLLSSTAPLTLDRYREILSGIKQRFPALHLRGLSATHIIALASTSGLTLHDTIAQLRDAGLDSIASNAVILDDQIRQRAAPLKCTTAEWVSVHRTAHQLGLPTAATMVFGVGETMEQRMDHLDLVRELQQQTGGFTSFTPLPLQPSNGGVLEPTAVEYLQTLAVSRLYLDNLPNLQGSWPTQGLKILQMSLRFGANDVGHVLLEERISKPGGATEEELRRIIREAGFKPAHRDALYRTMFLN